MKYSNKELQFKYPSKEESRENHGSDLEKQQWKRGFGREPGEGTGRSRIPNKAKMIDLSLDHQTSQPYGFQKSLCISSKVNSSICYGFQATSMQRISQILIATITSMLPELRIMREKSYNSMKKDCCCVKKWLSQMSKVWGLLIGKE